MPEEIAQSASVETSTASTSPDTASIAASVMADMDNGGGDTSGEVTTPNPEQKAETTVDPDDFDSVPAEVTDSLGRKKANSIPHPRVATMVKKAQNKVIAEVAKQLGITKAEAELKLEDVTGALTERGTKFKSYEDRIGVMDTIDQIMSSDGDRFIRMLAETNPQLYGKFAKVLEAATTQQAAADDDGEPQPDMPMTDDPNGPKTFSMAGLKKWGEWNRRQAVKDAEGKVAERLKPIEDERKAAAERQQAETLKQRAGDAVTAQLEKAKKWYGFEDNAPEILKALQANPSWDLHDAYHSVMSPKIAADRTKMREELIAEQNALPRNTSTPATGTTKPVAGGAKDTASIAREVLKELGG